MYDDVCTLLRRCTLQEARPEAARSAAAEQLDSSSAQPNSLKQDAKTDSEEAPQVGIGLDEKLNGTEGGTGEPEDGVVWSGSISAAAGEITGDDHAVIEQCLATGASAVPSSISSMPEQWTRPLGSTGEEEALSKRDASAAPSSSSSTPKQWAEASHTYIQDADATGSGWATVKPSRRKIRRQAENAVPASLHQAAAAALPKNYLPLPSTLFASGHQTSLPEAFHPSHDTQVRHWKRRVAHSSDACCAHLRSDIVRSKELKLCCSYRKYACQEGVMLVMLSWHRL